MLAYAANTRPLGRSESPKALIFIVAGHAFLLGALFMSKTEAMRHIDNPIEVTLLPDQPKPPPPKPIADPQTAAQPTSSIIDRTPAIVPLVLPQPVLDAGPTIIDVTPYIGTVIEPRYVPPITPRAEPIKIAARFVTPENLLRPPYPTSKLRAEEEASLRLRLSIDPRGRVVAVDPVGSTDRAFLDAARRHILKSWRYQPATEDGAAIASVVVITLKFRLNQA